MKAWFEKQGNVKAHREGQSHTSLEGEMGIWDHMLQTSRLSRSPLDRNIEMMKDIILKEGTAVTKQHKHGELEN